MLNKTIDSIKMEENSDDLLAELQKENEFLTKLVDTIPAKKYFEQEIQEKITAEKHSVMDKAAAALKRNSRDTDLSAKVKHKRNRLDPLQQKSVSQIQEELKMKSKKVKHKATSDSATSFDRAANLDELKKRLQEKIQLFQAQRKAVLKDPTKNKKLKTMVKKMKQKHAKLIKAETLKKIEMPQTPKTESKPVFNKDINLIYSKFDFNEDGQTDKKKSEYSGKKVKNLLKQAEKKKEKIENLKTADPEKAKAIEEKEKWKKAILKTEGLKVKDDPNLLKKSLKKEEKKRKHNTKAWKERIEDTQKRQKNRQDKRTKNIQKRKQDKFQKKIKSAKKKGRVMPDFKT